MNQPCPQQSNPQNLWELQLGLELTRTIDSLHEKGILYGRWNSATRVIFYGNLESHEGSCFVVVYPEDLSKIALLTVASWPSMVKQYESVIIDLP